MPATGRVGGGIATVTTQLRDYHVEPAAWKQFLAAWCRQVPPLRAVRGFQIEAWAVVAEARLLWFLSYPGTVDEFEVADRAYYDSPERLAFDPDPRKWLSRAEHQFVERLSLPR